MSGSKDLLSVDIQRGRDAGIPTYNTIRELCGRPKAKSFENLADTLSIKVSFRIVFLKLYYNDRMGYIYPRTYLI